MNEKRRTLSEIVTALLSLRDDLDAAGGEMDEQLEADLDAAEGALADKANMVLWAATKLDAQADAIDARIESLRGWSKSLRNEAGRVRAWLLTNLRAASMTKIETPDFRASVRRSERVEVVDFDAVPEEYRRIKTTIDVDKAAAKDAMKRGEAVPGLAVSEHFGLVVK